VQSARRRRPHRPGPGRRLTSSGPGYGASHKHVSWDEWFATFDDRRLNFIYQEETKDGDQSNFFRLESPDREDG